MIVPAYKTLRNIHFSVKFGKKNSPHCQLSRLEPSICRDVRPNITRDVSVEFNILVNCKVGWLKSKSDLFRLDHFKVTL